MKTVVCLAGGIASGKTTLAKALVEQYPNASVRSFGDVVRRRARDEGLTLDRATLQDLGLRLISEGWAAFVGQLVADVPDDAQVLIVDGVRHVEAVEELRRRYPGADVQLVYLDTDEAAVRERLRERGETGVGLGHLVEAELAAVRAAADTVVSSPGVTIKLA